MSYKNPHLIWSASELGQRLDEPDLVVLDARTAEEFAAGHVPGARSLDIFGISLIDTRPDPLRAFLWIIEHLIGARGVSPESRVVVYDRISGERAARIFWFLEYFGHGKVHVLDGGFEAWSAGGGPTSREAEPPRRAAFEARPVRDLLATADDVLSRLGRPDAAILDVRSAEENQATLIRSARGGRIPGAVHLEWKQSLSPDGTFKPASRLEARFLELGVTPDREVIPYCQGGYRSAHTFLALRLLGYPRVRNYVGSWGEWGNREELPIEAPPYPAESGPPTRLGRS
jgi:thiosulfate/3-mercaptopyruvate sulfurtransferase